MTVKSAAVLVGLIFIVVGILGYVDNPIVGDSPDAIFHADSTHNMVHIISGAVFLLIAILAPSLTRTFMIIFGLVYLGLGIMGMVNTGEGGMVELLGFLHVNNADNYLHIGLGVVILLLALTTQRRTDVQRQY